MTNDQTIALVTGANKGIGFEVARALGQAGVQPILGARDPERGTAAAQTLSAEGHATSYLQLDVRNEASVAAAAAAIEALHGQLDILVNNAGIADSEHDGPPSVADLQSVRNLLETNFVGTLAVTQAMLPLLRRSAAARIINLSSALGSLTINGDPNSPFYDARLIGYNASKAAVNMLTVQLAAELADSGIAVTSVSPGFVQTDLTHGQGSMTPAEGAITPVRYSLLEDSSASGRHYGPDGELPW